MMKKNSQLIFRKAENEDISKIWETLQQAILRRRKDGSQQWQDGYPNLETVKTDLQNNFGYVLTDNGEITTYCAIIYNYEPAYNEIEGKWLSDNDFYVVHRVAAHNDFAGKGYATEILKKIEYFSKSNNVFSIKIDTNYDNVAMLKILDKLGYIYCGEVHFRGSARKAFEKILK